MRRIPPACLASVVLTIASGSNVIGQTKTTNKPKTVDAPPQGYSLLARYKEIDGEVESISPAMMTLKVVFTHSVKNASNPNRNNNRSRNRRTSPLQRMIQMRLAQIRAANNVHMEKDYLEFDLPLLENVVIRKVSNGFEYDEKGFPKETKGDPKSRLPGVPGELKDVRRGDDVRVYFGPVKSGTNRPQVRMILIEEAAPMASPGKKK